MEMKLALKEFVGIACDNPAAGKRNEHQSWWLVVKMVDYVLNWWGAVMSKRQLSEHLVFVVEVQHPGEWHDPC